MSLFDECHFLREREILTLTYAVMIKGSTSLIVIVVTCIVIDRQSLVDQSLLDQSWVDQSWVDQSLVDQSLVDRIVSGAD
jgi:hypothetical protein